MYSVENPAFPKGMSMLDRSIYGNRFTGVGAQILGPDDKYICQFSDKSKNFWGSKILIPSFFCLSHSSIMSKCLYMELKMTQLCV